MEGRLLTFHPEKTIILAGAGISMKEPALLPGGRDLTESGYRRFGVRSRRGWRKTADLSIRL